MKYTDTEAFLGSRELRFNPPGMCRRDGLAVTGNVQRTIQPAPHPPIAQYNRLVALVREAQARGETPDVDDLREQVGLPRSDAGDPDPDPDPEPEQDDLGNNGQTPAADADTTPEPPAAAGNGGNGGGSSGSSGSGSGGDGGDGGGDTTPRYTAEQQEVVDDYSGQHTASLERSQGEYQDQLNQEVSDIHAADAEKVYLDTWAPERGPNDVPYAPGGENVTGSRAWVAAHRKRVFDRENAKLDDQRQAIERMVARYRDPETGAVEITDREVYDQVMTRLNHLRRDESDLAMGVGIYGQGGELADISGFYDRAAAAYAPYEETWGTVGEDGTRTGGNFAADPRVTAAVDRINAASGQSASVLTGYWNARLGAALSELPPPEIITGPDGNPISSGRQTVETLGDGGLAVFHDGVQVATYTRGEPAEIITDSRGNPVQQGNQTLQQLDDGGLEVYQDGNLVATYQPPEPVAVPEGPLTEQVGYWMPNLNSAEASEWVGAVFTRDADGNPIRGEDGGYQIVKPETRFTAPEAWELVSETPGSGGFSIGLFKNKYTGEEFTQRLDKIVPERVFTVLGRHYVVNQVTSPDGAVTSRVQPISLPENAANVRVDGGQVVYDLPGRSVSNDAASDDFLSTPGQLRHDAQYAVTLAGNDAGSDDFQLEGEFSSPGATPPLPPSHHAFGWQGGLTPGGSIARFGDPSLGGTYAVEGDQGHLLVASPDQLAYERQQVAAYGGLQGDLAFNAANPRLSREQIAAYGGVQGDISANAQMLAYQQYQELASSELPGMAPEQLAVMQQTQQLRDNPEVVNSFTDDGLGVLYGAEGMHVAGLSRFQRLMAYGFQQGLSQDDAYIFAERLMSRFEDDPNHRSPLTARYGEGLVGFRNTMYGALGFREQRDPLLKTDWARVQFNAQGFDLDTPEGRAAGTAWLERNGVDPANYMGGYPEPLTAEDISKADRNAQYIQTAAFALAGGAPQAIYSLAKGTTGVVRNPGNITKLFSPSKVIPGGVSPTSQFTPGAQYLWHGGRQLITGSRGLITPARNLAADTAVEAGFDAGIDYAISGEFGNPLRYVTAGGVEAIGQQYLGRRAVDGDRFSASVADSALYSGVGEGVAASVFDEEGFTPGGALSAYFTGGGSGAVFYGGHKYVWDPSKKVYRRASDIWQGIGPDGKPYRAIAPEGGYGLSATFADQPDLRPTPNDTPTTQWVSTPWGGQLVPAGATPYAHDYAGNTWKRAETGVWVPQRTNLRSYAWQPPAPVTRFTGPRSTPHRPLRRFETEPKPVSSPMWTETPSAQRIAAGIGVLGAASPSVGLSPQQSALQYELDNPPAPLVQPMYPRSSPPPTLAPALRDDTSPAAPAAAAQTAAPPETLASPAAAAAAPSVTPAAGSADTAPAAGSPSLRAAAESRITPESTLRVPAPEASVVPATQYETQQSRAEARQSESRSQQSRFMQSLKQTMAARAERRAEASRRLDQGQSASVTPAGVSASVSPSVSASVSPSMAASVSPSVDASLSAQPSVTPSDLSAGRVDSSVQSSVDGASLSPGRMDARTNIPYSATQSQTIENTIEATRQITREGHTPDPTRKDTSLTPDPDPDPPEDQRRQQRGNRGRGGQHPHVVEFVDHSLNRVDLTTGEATEIPLDDRHHDTVRVVRRGRQSTEGRTVDTGGVRVTSSGGQVQLSEDALLYGSSGPPAPGSGPAGGAVSGDGGRWAPPDALEVGRQAPAQGAMPDKLAKLMKRLGAGQGRRRSEGEAGAGNRAGGSGGGSKLREVLSQLAAGNQQQPGQPGRGGKQGQGRGNAGALARAGQVARGAHRFGREVNRTLQQLSGPAGGGKGARGKPKNRRRKRSRQEEQEEKQNRPRGRGDVRIVIRYEDPKRKPAASGRKGGGRPPAKRR